MSTETPFVAVVESPIKPMTEAPAPPAPTLVVRPPVDFDPSDPVALYMNEGVFGQLQRVAKLMCASQLVPQHLRGADKLSDCFLVAAQAFRWGMDPFSVAQVSFVTKGKLGYEGKVIAALVNTSGRLVEALDYTYTGTKGKDRGVVVSGRFKGSNKDRTIEGTVNEWKTDNDKWVSMPDQMLAYRGAREWARRHMPEVILGIRADEEIGEVVEMRREPSGQITAAPIDEGPDPLLSAAAPPPDGGMASHSDVEIPPPFPTHAEADQAAEEAGEGRLFAETRPRRKG